MSEGLVPANSSHAPTAQPVGGGYAGDQMPAQPSQSHSIERMLGAVRRYKWLVAGVAVLAAGLGFVGTRFITPTYDVRATIWIESRGGPADRGPIRAAEILSSTGWIDLLRSFTVVDETVRKLALYIKTTDEADAPLFASFSVANRFAPGAYELEINRSNKHWTLKTKAGITADQGVGGDSVGEKVGFRWTLPPEAFAGAGERKVVFTVVTPREKSLELLGRLQTPRQQMGSSFLWLTYSDPDPKLAALTLNTWLSEYMRVAAEVKKRNVKEFAGILEGQLKYAEKATQQAESLYQRFRVNTITLPTEGGPAAVGIGADRDPAVMFYFSEKTQYENLKNDREILEKIIAEAAAGTGSYERMQLIPSVALSPSATPMRDAFTTLYATQAKLRTERQTFTDDYITVKELKKTLETLETQTLPQLAADIVAQLKTREADLERRLAGATKELEQIPPRTIEEMRLKRAVTVAEGLYTKLKNSYAEAQLAEASATPDVSVLDTAIAPLGPTSNTAPRIMLMAIAAGIGAGIGLALLLDKMDRRFRYPEQVGSELGLAIAGAVPVVPKKGISASSPEQVLQFVESFRSLRMHVTHSVPGEKVVLAVTSAAPADGKSLVSANLALSFAEAGLRTVLVDGDTRRGSLHRMFGLGAVAGLTDFLTEDATSAEVIRATSHANLSFVSCGRRHPRSPELLASHRLKTFVGQLSQGFDVVIFDTPPLAAGIDGFAISAAAGRILMVLRLGQTERRLVSAKLGVLDRLPVEVLGTVLNGVPLTGEFQYYAYTAGYSIDDGDPAGQLEVGSLK